MTYFNRGRRVWHEPQPSTAFRPRLKFPSSSHYVLIFHVQRYYGDARIRATTKLFYENNLLTQRTYAGTLKMKYAIKCLRVLQGINIVVLNGYTIKH